MKQQSPSKIPEFLAKAGTMGDLIAKKDWSKHSLGPIEFWPQSLKSSLSICLHSPFPMAVYWGEKLHILYNDAWIDITGDKHPWSLGRPAEVVWTDIWDICDPLMQKALKTGEGILSANAQLPMQRRGYVEECYFDYTFNPIYGEDNRVMGLLNVANETTQKILTERRNNNIRKLSEKSITVESPEAACILVANILSEAPADIPYALIYLSSPDGKKLRLAASTSIDTDSNIAVEAFDLDDASIKLPYKKAVEEKQIQIVHNLDKLYELPGGTWEEPSTSAAVVPITRPGRVEPYGAMLIGISPRLEFNDRYKKYFELVGTQTAFAVANAWQLRRKLILEAKEHDVRTQLSSAQAIGSIGVFSYDIPNNEVIADNSLIKMFGVKRKPGEITIPLETFTDAMHPEDKKWVLEEINKSITETKVFQAEYRLQIEGQPVKWVMARGRIDDDKDGNPARFPGVVFDITERKLIERELASSETKFSTLFESSIMGIAVGSVDGSVHEANETFLNMFGFTKKELAKGLSIYSLVKENRQNVAKEAFKSLMTEGEMEPAEREFVRKDGTVLPVLLGAVMLSGTGDRFIAFMLDISEQKQLLALNKSKDEFISIASHQLRTPATGVKQYLGMLIEGYVGELSKPQRDMLKTAYESNERQLVIVDDLLRVAQADASEIALIKEKINVVSLLEDVIKEQAQKFKLNEQSLTLTLPPNKAVYAELDPFHIRMVFENLIDNASKYTPAGKLINVDVAAGKKAVKIVIKDQGVGIRKKDMPKLFKKFSRIENSLSTTAGGTGLGLYWVHKIIELHNGSIEVSSEYKKGTEFVIILPTGINSE